MKLVYVLCFLSVICLTQKGEAITLDDCPAMITRDPFLQVFDNYCYEFVTYREKDFWSAQNDCVSKGGNLVKIYNQAVQDFIESNIVTVREAVWIGLTDHNAENLWEWMDGTIPTYTNWAPGQPGVVSGIEDCAAIEPWDNGRWHDYNCEDILFFVSAAHPYICQYGPYASTPAPTVPTPEPSTTPELTTLPPSPTPEPTTLQPLLTLTPELSTTPEPTTLPPSTTSPPPTITSEPPHPTPPVSPPDPDLGGKPTDEPATTTLGAPVSPSASANSAPSTLQCPTFVCALECGLAGYKQDVNGCQVCECDQ